MKGQAFLLLVLGLSVSVSGYPDTVPASDSVCKHMTPGHGPKPKTTQAPCKVFSSHDAIKSGDQVEVTISAVNPGQPFRGYYLQARDAQQNQIGTFTATPTVKVHSCGGIKATGAHHSSRADKTSVTIRWTAPKNYAGTATFTATCVQDFDNFWTLIRSAPVQIQL